MYSPIPVSLSFSPSISQLYFSAWPNMTVSLSEQIHPCHHQRGSASLGSGYCGSWDQVRQSLRQKWDERTNPEEKVCGYQKMLRMT